MMRYLATFTLAFLGCNAILGHSEGHLMDASTPDASTDDVASPMDVVAPPLPKAPGEIFGTQLSLWLDADDSATLEFKDDRMTGWKDKSTFGNNARVIYSPGVTSPLQTADVNGRGVVRMTGAVTNSGIFEVSDRAGVRFQTGDFLVAVIAAYRNTPGFDEWANRGVLFSKVEAGWPLWGTVLMGNAFHRPLPDGGLGEPESVVFGGVKTFVETAPGAFSATDGWNDDDLHFFAVQKISADQKVYLHTDDQVSSGTIDVTHDLSAAGSPVQIGGTTQQGSCCFSALAGVFAEVIAVKGTTEKSQMDDLKKYAVAKYHLY